MRNYKVFCLLACCLVFLFPVIGLSEVGTEISGPVYVIDMQRVVSESIIGKAARNNVEEAARKKQATMKSKEVQLQAERDKLRKQQSLLSGEALEEKVSALQKKERDLRRQMEDNREELAKLSQKELTLVVGAADDVIKELGAKKGYPFIVENDPRVIVYTRKEFDLTEEVIELLDKRKVGL